MWIPSSVTTTALATRQATSACARYGGEEFALLLPHPASPVSAFVTVSLGVSSITPTADQQEEGQLLVRQTDAALYQAKAAGRNRTCVFGQNRS